MRTLSMLLLVTGVCAQANAAVLYCYSKDKKYEIVFNRTPQKTLVGELSIDGAKPAYSTLTCQKIHNPDVVLYCPSENAADVGYTARMMKHDRMKLYEQTIAGEKLLAVLDCEA